MERLGIDMQTMLGMPPDEHILLAAALGCGHVSISLSPLPWRLDAFPDWSLRTDRALRVRTVAAARETGVLPMQGEGFLVRPGTDVAGYAEDLDLLADLGVGQVSGVVVERDRSRAMDQLAMVADMADARGMLYLLEFAPPHAVGTLGEALKAIASLDRQNVRVLIDAMHLFRSGGTAADVAALDPEVVGRVQLCDVPRVSPDGDYLREACHDRLIPGLGELPLRPLLAALPEDVPVALELPMAAAAAGPAALRACVSDAVQAGRALLDG